MRIFYFITKSSEGGAQTVVYELLLGHKRNGDEVKVMAEGEGWLAQKTVELGFAYEENKYMRKSYNPLTLLRAMKIMRSSVMSFGADIVSTHSSFSGIIGRFAIRNSIPVVYTTHGWGFTYGKNIFKFLNILGEKLAGIYTEKIICVSERDKRIALQYKIVPGRKLAVIYNGVSVNKTFESVSGNELKIGFIGRIDWPKRQDLLVEAISNLPENLGNQIKVLFIGDGPGKSALIKQTKKLNIDQLASITGNMSREEALKILSTCSISVLLSESEGMPMSVLESLRLGIPVVANAVGGISEAVDSTVGRLLPSNPTPKALTNALAELIEKTELRIKLSIAALARGEKFSAENMCKETFSLYSKILSSS